MNFLATAIDGTPNLSATLDFEAIHSNREELEVVVLGEADDGSPAEVTVLFQEVIGFRCLDETDLLEFWPTCSLVNGWLYEIRAGGWRDLESGRSGFSSKSVPFHREFLVVTRDNCVSVISKGAPTLTCRSARTPLRVAG